MKKLYSPKNEVELSLIKSIFDGEGIPYFVHNDHFGSLKIGPRISLFNEKTIMVDEKYFDHAKEIIEDFIQNVKSSRSTEYSIFDKIRMVIEVFLFGWIMPGKRGSKKDYNE